MRTGLAVLACGLLLTAAASWRTAQSARAEAQQLFERRAERLDGSLSRRIVRLQNALKAARAAHLSLGGFDHQRFRAYVEMLEADQALPGVRGIGLAEVVARADLDAYVARARQEQPQFTVTTRGDAPDLLVVRYIEPRQRYFNEQALGYDLGAEPLRRAAAQQAVDTGEATISAPIEFKRDPVSPVGWLMFVPVYRPGLPHATPEQRRASLESLLYTRIGVADVMASLTTLQDDQLQFRMFDGPVESGQLVHDSRGPSSATLAPPPGVPMTTSRLQVGGRSLSVQVWSTRPVDTGAAVPVALVGLALSLLAAMAAGRFATRRETARQARLRSRAEQRRIEELMHLTDIVAIGLDDRLRVRWVNPGFSLLTGWSDDECAGRPAGRLLHSPERQLLLSQAADRVRHGAATAQLQLKHQARNGGTVWLDATLQPDVGGGFVLRAIDITARRHAEERLAESEHLLRMVLDNVPARVSYWGTDQRLRLANRSFTESVKRLAGDALIGRSLPEVMGEDVARELAPGIERVMAGEPQRFESQIRRRDGSRRVLLVHLVPDWADGQVCGAFSLALDVSELKEAQEEAQRASEAKTQFLSHMSHEIRTPMNAVIGMLTLLRGTGLDPRQADYARKAESSARSLLGLLNDILDLSKIEAGRMVLDPAPFRPDVLLHDLASILAGAAHGKGLALDVELDPALPPVLVGDDLRLRQVLVNLGGNAVKFTRAGRVGVAMRMLGREGGRVRVGIAVEDTGIGIAPEDQARVFSDFSQASAATTRQFGGTGLGLGICRRLVAMMGSELLLESEPGKGSRFHFELLLPLAPESASVPLPRQTEPAPLEGGAPLQGLRLLVVEDNPVNQQVARELLTGEGATVTLASDGAEGVRSMQSARGGFDAVLMDMQMPVMDGCSAAREIRDRLGDHRTPIIAMTANAMASDRERCLAAGMNDHVAKPFDLAELVAVLRRHTRARDADAQEPSSEPLLDFDLPVAAGAPASPQEPAPAATGPAQPVRASDLGGPAPLAIRYWDRDAALQRTGGNAHVLEQVLPVFRRNLQELDRQLRELAAGRPAKAGPEALFHTLKGMAGTLAADELSQRAAAAESAMRQGGDSAALAAQVQQAVEGTLAALDAAG